MQALLRLDRHRQGPNLKVIAIISMGYGSMFAKCLQTDLDFQKK